MAITHIVFLGRIPVELASRRSSHGGGVGVYTQQQPPLFALYIYTPMLLNREKNNIFLYLIKPGAERILRFSSQFSTPSTLPLDMPLQVQSYRKRILKWTLFSLGMTEPSSSPQGKQLTQLLLRWMLSIIADLKPILCDKPISSYR